MKIIDSKNSPVGRIASFAAKESLKGEEIAIVNCENAIISGNKKNIKKEFEEKRGRIGTLQVGPKISRDSEKYFKRIIRGMLPNYRWGRGRDALKRIKCYRGIPEQFKNEKMINIFKQDKLKFIQVKEITK